MPEKKTKYRFEQSGEAHKLYIYDDVTAYGDFNWETWQYEDSETGCKYFRDQLNAIAETEEIELHINSCGGSVKEGIAIYNLLKQHGAHKTCYVDGYVWSIASVIALACDKIVMGLGTSMLVHNMAMEVYGNAEVLRKAADDLDTLMEGNRKIYMSRAKNLTEEQLTEMMDAETFLTPEQCLEYGFCDEIGEYQADAGQMSQQADIMIEQLKNQLKEMQMLRQEMKAMAGPAQGRPPKPPEGLDPKEKNNKRVLDMMGAFMRSFDNPVM